MSRKILINDMEPGEVRVALLEDDRLDDLFIEREGRKSYLGNVYLAKILNVEPAIQAAFVDFGEDRNGFLHASDVMPLYGAEDAELTAFERRPRGAYERIQDLLHEGQTVLVQVTRDGIGTKGPTLTTYLSIPGKYMVLMPSLGRVGVSKKIRDFGERRRLKSTIREIERPKDMGVIVRTAGVGRTKEELEKDLGYLLNLWEAIVRRTGSSRAPAAIYRESDLVIRAIRDMLAPDTDEIVVDSAAVFDRVSEFLGEVMPEALDRLVLFEDDEPLFHAYEVEKEIERLFHRKVPLTSGGSLIIEQTEALVAIDVNSGRYRKEPDLEATAHRMNMEAVPEICRQLRLRDLGGLIAIDMIDMRDPDHKKEVERSLRRELRKDRARVRVAAMSDFGIVELTRQRVRPSLRQETYVPCRMCHGTGFVKSLDSMVLKVLRDIQAYARRNGARVLVVNVPELVAGELLNHRRASLLDLERRFEKRIVVAGDPELMPEDVRIRAKR